MPASARFVVVGGGVVAAGAAYHLARRGAAVVIVEGAQAGTATDAGAGIICPWTAPLDGAWYRLCCEGARHYPDLLAMLADDGEVGTGYARVGALYVAQQAEALHGVAGLLRSRQAAAPGMGEVTALAPGEPSRMFPPLAADLAGLCITGGARVDGRAIRDSLLRAAARRGARRVPGNATLVRAGHRVTGVQAGAESIGADAVMVAAGAWTAQVCAGLGIRLPVGPQRGQIVHTRLPGTDTASWPVVLAERDPYLVAFPGGRVVVGATREDAGFQYHSTVGGVGGLLAGAVSLAPGLRGAELMETRIGLRPVTSDGRPLLGPVADGLIVATGHGPEGLTAGPWSSLAMALLALGEPPVTGLAPFSPGRFQSR
ncbi:MAG TPA: FAD-dependent oxidoreductase [Streptosporangiaceae bacterium]|nr:FAD-dependent oxidoreductase [Streptosporangiaceae bacterium]